jgi:hypothetical protein
MSTTQMVTISFEEGATWVHIEGIKIKFDSMIEAIGFACRMKEEERDQPCILVPPNALLPLLLDPTDLNQQEWNSGVGKAEQVLATVTR